MRAHPLQRWKQGQDKGQMCRYLGTCVIRCTAPGLCTSGFGIGMLGSPAGPLLSRPWTSDFGRSGDLIGDGSHPIAPSTRSPSLPPPLPFPPLPFPPLPSSHPTPYGKTLPTRQDIIWQSGCVGPRPRVRPCRAPAIIDELLLASRIAVPKTFAREHAASVVGPLCKQPYLAPDSLSLCMRLVARGLGKGRCAVAHSAPRLSCWPISFSGPHSVRGQICPSPRGAWRRKQCVMQGKRAPYGVQVHTSKRLSPTSQCVVLSLLEHVQSQPLRTA